MSNSSNKTVLGNIGNVGVDINLTAVSALYLCLAIVIPIVVYFTIKKYGL